MSERGVWLRSREQSAIIAVGLVVFGVVGLVLVASSGSRSGQILGGLGIAIYLAVGARVALMGAFVGPDGLRIRNPLRTHSIRWSDCQGFRVGRYGLPRVAIADLNDGRSIPIFGIGGPPPSTRPRDQTAELLVSELNGMLRSRQPE